MTPFHQCVSDPRVRQRLYRCIRWRVESSHRIVWLDVVEVLNLISSVRLMRCDERAFSFPILSPLSTLIDAFEATEAGCGSREVLVAGCPLLWGPGRSSV